MDREILAIGNTGAQLVSKFNDNFTTLNKRNWFNVEDYGATHDNVHDDTPHIQAAINACAAAGGGVVWFPIGIYLIAGALQNGIPEPELGYGVDYNSQIYIPSFGYTSTDYAKILPIKLKGESPLNIWFEGYNDAALPTHVVLRSTIAGSGTNPSVICSRGIGVEYNTVYIEDITVLVNPFKDTTGPSMCGVNLLYTYHSRVDNLNVWVDTNNLSDIIQPAAHVFGIGIGRRNDGFPVVGKIAVVGFYYGVLLGEGITVNLLGGMYNYIGVMFLSANMGSVINYINMGASVYYIASQQETIAGEVKAATNVKIHYFCREILSTANPAWCTFASDILDNDNYLYGEMNYKMQYADDIVKNAGGYNLLTKNFATPGNYKWTTATRPTIPGRGCTGYNTTTDKLECWNGATWNNLF